MSTTEERAIYRQRRRELVALGIDPGPDRYDALRDPVGFLDELEAEVANAQLDETLRIANAPVGPTGVDAVLADSEEWLRDAERTAKLHRKYDFR